MLVFGDCQLNVLRKNNAPIAPAQMFSLQVARLDLSGQLFPEQWTFPGTRETTTLASCWKRSCQLKNLAIASTNIQIRKGLVINPAG